MVVPDVIVQRSGRGWKVQLNPDVMPKLRINDLYAQAIRGQRNGTAAGLNARLQEARWFVKNIQQRFDTIVRVSQAIVERQKGFFTHGAIAMKPLVLREIADELGLHESTISRVTTAKYMATPYGTFELKYFFGSSLSTDAGGNASSTAVRALLRQLVAAEDPKAPLSDGQLAQMLSEQGIQVARRTVAKYREALKIAPANLRRSAVSRLPRRSLARRGRARCTPQPARDERPSVPALRGRRRGAARRRDRRAAAGPGAARRARRRGADAAVPSWRCGSTWRAGSRSVCCGAWPKAPYRSEHDLYALAHAVRWHDWITPQADAARGHHRAQCAAQEPELRLAAHQGRGVRRDARTRRRAARRRHPRPRSVAGAAPGRQPGHAVCGHLGRAAVQARLARLDAPATRR